MAEVPVERKFIGSVRLATLHLWRVAKTTDLERCFKEARDLRMINQENEDFIRRCFALDALSEFERRLQCHCFLGVYALHHLQLLGASGGDVA